MEMNEFLFLMFVFLLGFVFGFYFMFRLVKSRGPDLMLRMVKENPEVFLDILKDMETSMLAERLRKSAGLVKES